ncbi:protein O-glucosyltransferase 1-like isoform X1 [Leptotrombidium deliense]|uniref:Protein O-glucosyltransferase 1-like isoform X1 n=1 Tax=Leptotrombidium deliense TaxID=299467 RepID=A0A443SM60_9ACAR|nr:protein O-glucosyltransferase 1-like isoform X1 [Leptotrombidium deliense]
MLFTSFLFLFTFSYSLQEKQTSNDLSTEAVVKHEKLKYSSEANVNASLFKEEFVSDNKKFEKFFSAIENANKKFKKCLGDSCDCFANQIEADLKLFPSISSKDIEESKELGVHYQVINHKLYRQQSCAFPLRCKGIEYFLLKLLPDLNDSEFIINVHDWPQVPKYRTKAVPVLSFSKDVSEYNDILYPAWSFWSGGPAIDGHPMGIGRWDLLRQSIVKSNVAWNKKKSVAFFRGSRTSEERDPLILLSRRQPNIIDAKYTKNQAWRSKSDTLGEEPAKVISFEKQCNYKYLFNLRGVAASFRHRHLFLCKSLVLNVESPWIEFYYRQMKPWIHYVPIDHKFADVEETLEFLLSNDDIAEKIANTGYEFIWNHLTFDALECYWRKLLKTYEMRLLYKPKHVKTLIEIR